MKKCIVFCILVLGWSLQSKAQRQIPKIGDTIPGYFFNTMVNYKAASSHLSSFRRKPLIIEFWATWCGICLQHFPKADSLQKEFDGKLQFLLISDEQPERVRSFFKKRKLIAPTSLPSAADTTSGLHRLFKVRYVPHYVWIDANGVIRAITDPSQVTSKNISAFIKNNEIRLTTKVDEQRVNLDMRNGLFADQDWIKKIPLRQYTILTGRISGVSSQSTIPVTGTYAHRRFLAVNVSVGTLFRIAYGADMPAHLFPKSRTVLALRDTTRIRLDSLFSYDLILEKADSAFLTNTVKKDLEQRFGLKGRYARREMSCLVLKRTDGQIKESKALAPPQLHYDAYSISLSNQPISALIEILSNKLENSKIAAIVDETLYSGNIDLDIVADLADVASINKGLSKYNLKLEEAMRPTEVLVVSN